MSVLEYLQDVLSGRVAAQGVLGQNNYDPRASFAQNALNPTALQQAMDVAMGVSGGGLGTKSKSGALYHVAGPEWRPGEPLRSLYARYGDEAHDIFAKRWPDAGDLALEHPFNTFFYDGLNAAKGHVDEFGGQILKADRDRITSLYKNMSEDPGYWATQYEVPADALKAVIPKGVSLSKYFKGLLD